MLLFFFFLYFTNAYVTNDFRHRTSNKVIVLVSLFFFFSSSYIHGYHIGIFVLIKILWNMSTCLCLVVVFLFLFPFFFLFHVRSDECLHMSFTMLSIEGSNRDLKHFSFSVFCAFFLCSKIMIWQDEISTNQNFQMIYSRVEIKSCK